MNFSFNEKRIIERITPRFSHINPAVVFSAIKVTIKYLDFLKSQDLTKTIIKRLAPSLGFISFDKNKSFEKKSKKYTMKIIIFL